jgi:ABC-type transport system involved in multi-copper enzyme maturation permease subunit
MTKLIFLREFQSLISDKKFIYSSIIIIGLMIINLLSFRINYNNELETYSRVNSERVNGLEYPADFMSEIVSSISGQRKLNYLGVLHAEQKIVEKPSTLVFASSNHNSLPNGIKINYFKEEFPQYMKNINHFLGNFIAMDWEHIILYFISFLCLMLSYNAFSGEKETGTLKLMLVNSISRSKIIMGKYLSLLTGITIPFLLGVLITVLALLLFPNIQPDANLYLKLALFLIVFILFISLNIFTGFLISLLSKKSSISLIYGITVWILFLVILPSSSWIMGRNKVQIENRATLNQNIKQQVNEVVFGNKDKYTRSWRGSWATKPPNEFVIKRVNGFNKEDEIRNSLQRDHIKRQFAQVDYSNTFSMLSPYSVFKLCSEKITGSGNFKTKKLYTDAMNYAGIFREFMKDFDANDKESFHLISRDNTTARLFCSQKEVNAGNIPRFIPSSTSLANVMNSIKVEFIILFLWCAILFWGVFVLFIKYDVR